ncbi:SDR family oxidoreductase [Haloflavibacter putidus]|uniref:SDR family oxidoreductase n=1 Tax=Haloflavibacter putidus TaxID=2576776 RepID=A0A507ZR73_9FLAO|nr:SDR family oxidoreductase [Haloflavibacter putidus]TQD39477.1 SDR family oxidoreductase [Haloflavibacter putidus]
MNTKENILVAGANGTTGKLIIDILKKSETYNPIAMVRKQEQKDNFDKQQVQTVMADLEGDVSQTVQGADKVIFAAGSGGENVYGVDQEGAKKMVDAAKEAGLKKFVMLGSIGTDDPSQGGDLTDYLKAKQNADTYLQSSGLDYSIVRPGALTNADATGKIQTGGIGELDKSGYISRADVAHTLVEVLPDAIKLQETFEIMSGDTPIKQAIQ